MAIDPQNPPESPAPDEYSVPPGAATEADPDDEGLPGAADADAMEGEAPTG